MKIVNLETLSKMPAGTIFAPYAPYCILDNFTIKIDESYKRGGSDPKLRYFFERVMPLIPKFYDKEKPFEKIGQRKPADFTYIHNNNFDYKDYEQFVILEKDDVNELIENLIWAKEGCKRSLNV